MTIAESLWNLLYVQSYQNLFIYLQYDLLAYSLHGLVRCLRALGNSFTKSCSILRTQHGILFTMMKTPSTAIKLIADSYSNIHHLKDIASAVTEMSMQVEMQMQMSAELPSTAMANPVNIPAKYSDNTGSNNSVSTNNCCICDEDDFEIIFEDMHMGDAYSCSPTDNSNCSSSPSSSCNDSSVKIMSIQFGNLHDFHEMTNNMSVEWSDDDDDDDNSDDNSAISNIRDENADQQQAATSPPVFVVKKVRFNLQPKIYVMRTWSYAYKAARKGCWEEFARDRCRFQKRIHDVGEVLNPVLDAIHRNKIYECRFSNAVDTNQELNVVN